MLVKYVGNRTVQFFKRTFDKISQFFHLNIFLIPVFGLWLELQYSVFFLREKKEDRPTERIDDKELGPAFFAYSGFELIVAFMIFVFAMLVLKNLKIALLPILISLVKNIFLSIPYLLAKFVFRPIQNGVKLISEDYETFKEKEELKDQQNGEMTVCSPEDKKGALTETGE